MSGKMQNIFIHGSFMNCESLITLRLEEEKFANRSKKQTQTQDTFGALFLPI